MQSLKNATLGVAIITAIWTSPLFGQETPVAPPPRSECLQGIPPAPQSEETQRSRLLGERLSESKGVICPPKGVDPGIVEKPPPTNAPMPVIPPPGTRGGDPGTQPK